MNKPLSKAEIKELPLGLTSNVGPNRRQRKQYSNRQAFISPSKNHPLLVNQLSNNSFSKVLRIRQLTKAGFDNVTALKEEREAVLVKPRYIEHYKLVK